MHLKCAQYLGEEFEHFVYACTRKKCEEVDTTFYIQDVTCEKCQKFYSEQAMKFLEENMFEKKGMLH